MINYKANGECIAAFKIREATERSKEFWVVLVKTGDGMYCIATYWNGSQERNNGQYVGGAGRFENAHRLFNEQVTKQLKLACRLGA